MAVIYESEASARYVLALAALLLLAVFVSSFIYTVITNPLTHVPGPLVSRFSNWRLKYAVLTGERARYVHALHERYGSVVRISPWEVSLADVSAARTIYKVGGPYLKSDWYFNFTGSNKFRNIFVMTDSKQHGNHRRLIAHNFSEKWIRNMEPFIAKNVRLTIDKMAIEATSKGYFDVFKWFTFMATDVIGESSFGESFRMLETEKKNQYITDLETVGKLGVIRAEFPNLTKLLAKLPFGKGKEMIHLFDRLNTYSEESTNRYWKQWQADPENVKPTLLTKIYANVEAGTVDPRQLAVDARGNIVAGTDTTAIAATYAVYLLSRHPQLEERLIDEVSHLPADFTDEDLKQLHFLNNVITETLRLRSPVGQSLPRLVPPEGASFGSYFLPGGTIVGIQAWTMHRDPKIWSSPESFEPGRWNNPTKEMKDCYLPFGGGSRICIGMHFAQLELRYALANFYRCFTKGAEPSTAEGFSEGDMKQMSYFLTPPKGKKCLISPRQ